MYKELKHDLFWRTLIYQKFMNFENELQPVKCASLDNRQNQMTELFHIHVQLDELQN
jgi:hypothetical protein